ncbi:DNA polymerase III subunit alpha [Bacillus cereus]|uniref:DNA polymerase III subunit alpha n=1 Tax=Bacillus cereus TaxID=1396 RepID=UPI003D65A3E9
MTLTLTNNKIVPFAHLHLHTPEGSLLDGFCRIDPMIKLAQEFGMDSIGVSDHGTCFAHIQFYKKCKAAGIHPVLGMEGYIAPRKQWKKADFDRINYTDVAYRTKEELAKLESEEYVAFEKKQRDSFTKGKTTKPEHIEFLAKLYEKDPVAFDALKKSTRWYLSGKQDDKQKRLFGWSPRIAHLLMIAKNNEGYKNLIKLTTIGSIEGFYGKPRFDYGDIKKYGKGIIATSSCLGGTIPQLIRRGKFRVAKNHIKFYKKCFDEFYLEIQPSTMQEQILVNNILIEWSKELDVPLVATSDAHMLRPEDRPVHKAITSINKGKDEDESDIDVYEHCVFYSAEEMLAMGMPEEALINAYNIAHSCHVDLDESSIKYPEFEVPDDFDFDSYLAHISNKGLMEKIAEGNFVGKNFYKMYRKYKRRLDYELEVIKNKNISAYMLIVWDYINFAKRNDILVGPGRGSAAGSLVAYVTGITNLDPIRYNLLFERFINPERPGFPDIDTDFDYLRRHEVIEYVTKKYGADNVAQIATFGTLSTKSALKDIGRALGIDHNEINEVNKYIPSHQGKVMPISEALEEIKEVQAYAKKYPRLFELALEVESMPRTQGIHACGMLITAEPITNEVALVRGKGGESVAAYDGPTLEAKGYIKFDFLGLKNLSVIELCRRMVEERHGHLIDVDNLIPEDKLTFEKIREGETAGLFQIESDGMRKMFMGMNSVNFDDLVAGVALYRPGPMEKIPGYVARKNGHEEVPSIHPIYDEITAVTYGFLVYQEQVMEISKKMAGYSMGEADVLRKAVGKKKQEILDPALEELYSRMIAKGIPMDVAQKACDDIRPFAGYGFNLSHAACYAFISYQTAYLKANYPIEYMAALLQVFYTEEEKVVKLVKVTRDMGIEVLPPDINKSESGFIIDGESTIRFGLGSIKGLGEATLEAILEERKPRMAPAVRDADGLETVISIEEAAEIEATPDLEIVVGSVEVGGPFTSAQDVINRIPKKNFNKKAIESLCYSGAFDGLAEGLFNNRFEYLAHMFDVRGEKPDAELIEQITKYTDRSKFEKEREVLGLYVSGHVLDRLAEPTDWEGLDDATHTTMVSLTEARVIRTKKGDNMAFLRVDTLEGERSLTLFPSHYEQVKEGLVPGMLMKVGIKGQMNWQRNQKDFIINSITIPKKINKDIWKQIEKENVQVGVA